MNGVELVMGTTWREKNGKAQKHYHLGLSSLKVSRWVASFQTQWEFNRQDA